jgi:hypothetical protein
MSSRYRYLVRNISFCCSKQGEGKADQVLSAGLPVHACARWQQYHHPPAALASNTLHTAHLAVYWPASRPLHHPLSQLCHESGSNPPGLG